MKIYSKEMKEMIIRDYDKGVTQQELVKRYKVNRRTIYDWTKERTAISVKQLLEPINKISIGGVELTVDDEVLLKILRLLQ